MAHVVGLVPSHNGRQLPAAAVGTEAAPVLGRRSLRIAKNCDRSMKNGSARSPAKTCMPVADPSVELIEPLTVVPLVSSVLAVPVTEGFTGPRTVTCCEASLPLKVTWKTRSSRPSGTVLVSILIW